MLNALIEKGVRFDAAISIWVLQHCLEPATDIRCFEQALKADGELFIVNNLYRAVPTLERGWANDGIDIKKMLVERFALRSEGRIPPDVTTKHVSELTFWASFVSRR